MPALEPILPLIPDKLPQGFLSDTSWVSLGPEGEGAALCSMAASECAAWGLDPRALPQRDCQTIKK